MKQVEIHIKGVVQGVGYRNFTLRTALSFGIIGTVENLSDGSVCVYAQAPEHILNQFVDALKKGPRFAQVDQIIIKNVQDDSYFQKLSTFKIVSR